MKSVLATSLVTVCLIAPTFTYAADTTSTKETIRESISDAVITTKIKAEFAKDKEVSAMRIKVDTDDKGVVTLAGEARSRMEADKAVRIARDTKGVTMVKDEIKVQAK